MNGKGGIRPPRRGLPAAIDNAWHQSGLMANLAIWASQKGASVGQGRTSVLDLALHWAGPFNTRALTAGGRFYRGVGGSGLVAYHWNRVPTPTSG